jgi:hypothetical protein
VLVPWETARKQALAARNRLARTVRALGRSVDCYTVRDYAGALFCARVLGDSNV